MKVSRFYTVILAVLVAISLVCTYWVMFKPKQDKVDTTTIVTVAKNDKQIGAFFKPNQMLMYHNDTLQLTYEEESIDAFVNLLDHQKMTFSSDRVLSSADYLAFLSQKSAQYIFPAPMTFQIAKYLCNIDSGDKIEETFTRFVFVFSDSNTLYAVNDKTKHVYSFSLEKPMNYDTFYSLEQKYRPSFFDVEAVQGKDTYYYVLSHNEIFKQRMYLLEQINPTQYIKTLFGSTINLKNESTSTAYRYVNNQFDLTIGKDTGLVLSTQYRTFSTPQYLQTIATQLDYFEKWPKRVLFAGQNGETLHFRRYVAKLPIMDTVENFSTTRLKVRQDGIITTMSSSYILQTELSMKRKDIAMMSFQDMQEAFEQQDKSMADIDGVGIFYTIQPSKTKVITLVPEWYVFVNDTAKRLVDYLAE
ncbi:hypothetical protein H1220_08120 [Carnobacteriaceae bacterium zg-84]|uniref:hypothetical protein n=1 Tax=Granulicatella sp. zg-84 TaxID=2678503 RepID=UPI0013C22022|nr:hypothetical protein [Granulicatella sp. zg-84]NEW66272.1 hypothetical protein [Granulicatella sp. zg-84]QMI85640.1 hypothetical protein H1220_08120 [Carnobacteriaceae bacterium zg-84]